MGTPEFAVASLDALMNSKHEVAAVVTATDKLGGRGGKQLLQSDIKKYAIEKSIKVLQPERLKSKEFINELKLINADIFIVVAFRMLPEMIWNMPACGTYNIHASLLPKYRGAAPINWAIINGEKETGVTFFKLKHEIDTGNILLQSKIEINDNDDFGTMYSKLKELGANTALQGLNMIENDQIIFMEQDEKEVSHAPKIFHETCKINFNQTAEQVRNFIRGLSPYPAAYFDFYGEEMKVYKSKPIIQKHDHQPGEIIMKGLSGLLVTTVDGYIDVLELKLENLKRMSYVAFYNGYVANENQKYHIRLQT